MSKQQDERTLQMMRSFMKMKAEGHTIKEIAEMFNLSGACIYSHLDAIAKENGISNREELLDKPTRADHSNRIPIIKEKLNLESFRESTKEAIKAIDGMKDAIKQLIKENEGEEQ